MVETALYVLRGLQKIQLELLYLQAARKLTGRAVDVMWKTPFISKTRGIALRDGRRGLIYIEPSLDEAQQFKTFLHETAHIARHYDYLSDIGNFSRSTTGQPAPHKLVERTKTDEVFQQREQEARDLADCWFSMVEDQPTVKKKLEKLISSMG